MGLSRTKTIRWKVKKWHGYDKREGCVVSNTQVVFHQKSAGAAGSNGTMSHWAGKREADNRRMYTYTHTHTQGQLMAKHTNFPLLSPSRMKPRRLSVHAITWQHTNTFHKYHGYTSFFN